MENYQIYQGDSFKLIPLLPDKSIRLILTDPPYNISRKNNFKTMGRNGIDFGDWDKNFDQTGWLDDAREKLVDGGSIIIWNDWKNLGEIAKYLQNINFSIKRQLLWKKVNPWPRNIQRSMMSCLEHGFWAVKEKPKRKWIFNKRPEVPYETGVFEYPVQSSKLHPNKKPDGLFENLIKIFSNPGDLVADFFGGCGTTLFAAKKLDRRCIISESISAYVEEFTTRFNDQHGLQLSPKKVQEVLG